MNQRNQRDQGTRRRPVRFATFNVLHGRPLPDGGPPLSLAANPAEGPLARAVLSLGADVLALQELDRLQERSGRVDQAAVAADAAGLKHWRYASACHARSTADRGWILDPAEPGLRMYGPQDADSATDVPSHGIALLSRFPVRDWRARRLAPAPLGMPLRMAGRPGLTLVRDQPRAALAAVLEAPGGPFTAVAVHLSFVPGWNVAQLLAVRDWIADLPSPHVLLGDFNLIGALPRVVLNAPGKTRTPPSPRGWFDLARTPTYPAHRPVVQFDHVLANGVGVAAASGARTPATGISDHRPLVLELSL
ncbi:endonuclease/exonuclease/phosphatase family protein [Streptomyces mirabilis]|uniref:endonuclease/exonuclease/phosphatase family protein n=1 Tax=Streptomyces mirabilis TaxID=68239 RepID=UPI0036ACF807